MHIGSPFHEQVERLRTSKRAAVIGIHRLGLGPRATEFSVDDLSRAAHTAGEADPDQVNLYDSYTAREVPSLPHRVGVTGWYGFHLIRVSCISLKFADR